MVEFILMLIGATVVGFVFLPASPNEGEPPKVKCPKCTTGSTISDIACPNCGSKAFKLGSPECPKCKMDQPKRPCPKCGCDLVALLK